MNTSELSEETKFQQCIVEPWKLICAELKKYCETVNKGHKTVSLIIAHEENLKTISSFPESFFQDTEINKVEPDAYSKLKFSMERAIRSEEQALENILVELQESYSKIEAQLDKMRSNYKASFAEFLSVLDTFRRSFSDSHDGRKHTQERLLFEIAKKDQILKCWETTNILSLAGEMSLLLCVE